MSPAAALPLTESLQLESLAGFDARSAAAVHDRASLVKRARRADQ
jgi:hypothetical protein